MIDTDYREHMTALAIRELRDDGREEGPTCKQITPAKRWEVANVTVPIEVKYHGPLGRRCSS